MKTMFAGAAALTAVMSLTCPAAAAGPMVPLAPPACESFKFYGIMNIVEDPGQTILVSWSPDGMSGRTNTRDGYQSPNTDFEFSDGVANNGAVKGGITGRHVDYAISWDDGPLAGTTDQFYGQVKDDLSVSGNMRRGVNGQGTSWHMQTVEGNVKCIDPAASANTPPTQATVVAATDIYDKPDGNGKKIGSLAVGEVHPLMEPCRDDWCRVGQIELGGYEGLPNGTAWVYSKGYLTFS